MEELNLKMGSAVVEGTRVRRWSAMRHGGQVMWCMTFDMTDEHEFRLRAEVYGRDRRPGVLDGAVSDGMWLRVQGASWS